MIVAGGLAMAFHYGCCVYCKRPVIPARSFFLREVRLLS